MQLGRQSAHVFFPAVRLRPKDAPSELGFFCPEPYFPSSPSYLVRLFDFILRCWLMPAGISHYVRPFYVPMQFPQPGRAVAAARPINGPTYFHQPRTIQSRPVSCAQRFWTDSIAQSLPQSRTPPVSTRHSPTARTSSKSQSRRGWPRCEEYGLHRHILAMRECCV